MSYVYQYRVEGQPKIWQVRSSYGKAQLRAKLEAKAGKLDLLLLVRSATEQDSRLPCGHTVADITAEWDKAAAEPADDSWDSVMKYVMKQRKDTA